MRMKTENVMHLLRVSALGCFAAVMIGCSYQGDKSPEAAGPAPLALNAPEETMPATEHAGSVGGTVFSESSISDSWAEFVALQTPADQLFLEEVDHRYFGVMSYRTAEERDYMLRAGFPAPEEWLAARRMGDTELRARADAGDAKAAGMLADRMSRRLEELVALDESGLGAVEDSDRALVATIAVTYATQARQASRSPFGLYVDGMVKSSIFDSWEPMTAAMLEAMRRGDPRVERLMTELHARHPVQDIGAIHAALSGMENDPG